MDVLPVIPNGMNDHSEFATNSYENEIDDSDANVMHFQNTSSKNNNSFLDESPENGDDMHNTSIDMNAHKIDSTSFPSCAPAPMVEIKLFCGRVPKSMDEDDIRGVFEEFGIVKEVIIIRDKESNSHKFSAFVKMASIAHADAAIQSLSGQRTLDAGLGPLQVKYANGELVKSNLTESSATEAGVHQAKVFVGSLPKTVNEEQIRELFAPYGEMDEIFIMMDKASGTGKGCAFVKFAFKEQALFAIKSLDGKKTMDGCTRPIEVRFAESKAQKAQQFGAYGGASHGGGQYGSSMGGVMPQSSMMHVSMGGVGHPGPPSASTPRAVGPWKEYWTPEGRPYYHNEHTNSTQWEKPMEFDKSMMSSTASAALSGMNATSFGMADRTGPKGANIFIFYVPNEWTQADLINAFGSFGMIVSARIATDKMTGRNKGYAFVSYDNAQAAAYAVHHMNGYLALAKRLKVTIKKGEESVVQPLLDQLASQGGGAAGDHNRGSMYTSTAGQAAGVGSQYGNYMGQRYAPY